LAASVGSSSCMANINFEAHTQSTTWSAMSIDISLIELLAVTHFTLHYFRICIGLGIP